MELQSVLLKHFTQLLAELAAEDAAQRSDGQKEAWGGINPSGTVESQAASGNDVMHMGMMTSAPTIPCSRKATRSGFSILSIRFMVLLFRSSAGPSEEMAQSLSSIE